MLRDIWKCESYGKLMKLILLILANANLGLLTDVETLSCFVDKSLNFKVNIPVLSCIVKYGGYKTVTWFKDSLQVKTGPNNEASHLFSIASLINNSQFNISRNPLELQGYYWCETDSPPSNAEAHKFLFQIKNVNTYVGNFLITKNFLGKNNTVLNNEELEFRKEVYSHELENKVFGFLPKPNNLVTDIKSTPNGLQVHFFLYVINVLDIRSQGESILSEDERTLQNVIDHFNNEADTDPEYYKNLLKWASLRGVKISGISLKSTIGCFTTDSKNPGKFIGEISWPHTLLNKVTIPEEICTTKDGLPVTRVCSGSFNEGGSWGPVNGVCEKGGNNLSESLMDLSAQLLQNDDPVYSLGILNSLVKYETSLTAIDLTIIVNIEEELSSNANFEITESENLIKIISIMSNANVKELDAAKNYLQFTNRVLKIINNVLKKANAVDSDLEIIKPSILLYTKNTDADDKNINGAFVTTSENSKIQKNTIKFLTNGSIFPHYNSKVGFLLPKELMAKHKFELDIPCQMNFVYFKDWSLFNNLPVELSTVSTPETPVLFISLSGGSIWNLTEPVNIFFKHEFQQVTQNPKCVYFDPNQGSNGAWATEGCFYKGLANGYHICQCHHLSTFSLVLAKQARSGPQQLSFQPSLQFYIGCVVSVFGLLIAILVYLSSKTWRKTVDQDILFHLALSFLFSLIFLLIHDAPIIRDQNCLILSYIVYYFVLVMFSWLFIQSIIYRTRFSKKSETGDIPYFLVVTVIFTWGFSFMIILVMALASNHVLNGKLKCWSTLEEISGTAFIPILIFIILTICFNLNAAYSISCRYKKDFLVGNEINRRNVLKFRASMVCFLLLILSWVFGYILIRNHGNEMQTLFSIFIILSSIYVTLFFIFHDVSLIELCKNKPTISEPAAEIQSLTKPSYNSIEN